MSNAENKPAVVPASDLTSAKTTIVVNDPTITGKIIVKSKIELFPPNIMYRYAAVTCSPTCDVLGISRPSGYHDKLSCHFRYASRPLSTMYFVAL